MKVICSIIAGLALFSAAQADECKEKLCCAPELASGAVLPERSLYHLASKWTNDASEPLMLQSLRGKPQLVTMFFASCEFACPILVLDLKRIEAALPANLRTNIGFVLISFDAERDTPQALSRFRSQHSLPPNWRLLRGEPDDVQELAALLGVKYKRDQKGQFAHSNLITLLDADGEVAARQVGLNKSGEEIVETLKRAVAGK